MLPLKQYFAIPLEPTDTTSVLPLTGYINQTFVFVIWILPACGRQEFTSIASFMAITIIFSIAILIMSVVIHEVSHGYAAESLGDPTARLAGRLTLNPIKHLDLMGSFIVPILTYTFGGFVIGWAKPVPYNPYNLKHKFGDAIVAVAGPLSNLLLAVVFGLILRFNESSHFIPESSITLVATIVLINLILMIFNLVPIPPLDGSKILASVLPYKYRGFMQALERYSFFVIIFFIFFLWQFIFPVIGFMFRVLTGFLL